MVGAVNEAGYNVHQSWPGCVPRNFAMLTRADFAVAIRDALRHFARADLLLGSPLLAMRIVSGHGSKTADAAHLQKILADAAAAIFSNERDKKLLRVLELTYFRPVPKQEVVAERLGLSFGTYRRHLTTGVERLTEWLWYKSRNRRTTTRDRSIQM